MTEEQIFLAVLDLADSAKRSAYLDEVCGRDLEFRRHVEDLLAAHYRAGEFLDEPLGRQLETGSSTRIIKPSPTPPDGQLGDAVADATKRDEDHDDLHYLQPSTRPDSLGRIGHYEVLEILGRGGFGVVFRALDDVLERVVALKVLAPAIAATSPARKRFLREARSSAQVRHENVVSVFAVEEHPLPYLAMEFIPGESLQQRIDRTGPLETSEVVRLGRQIAEGLAAAHATGLIHRDIKPGNVLIESGSQRVKITDFGLARAADDASLTQSGVLAGTPMNMAPEQAKGGIARPPRRFVQPRQCAVRHGHRPAALPRINHLRRLEARGRG
jgi:serine/threonine protein kinase